MPLDFIRVRNLLKQCDFQTIFIEELGWDHHKTAPLCLFVDGIEYVLSALVEKRGMVVFTCTNDHDGKIPEYRIRQKIERFVAKYAHEHIIIYVNATRTQQIWQWVKREPGRPNACREHLLYKDQPGDSIIQKLQAIAFSLAEEENLTITQVASRARQAFDIEHLTKRFYDRFTVEHASFLKSIRGISVWADQEWYTSIMLNRLMFIYFIQKKGFLDGDTHYLRNHMRLIQLHNGQDEFLSFYRHFLLRLFHEGLGQRVHPHELDTLLGRVPFLNGGLFEIHELEQRYPDIEIPDVAFERVFDFFDAYQWHLDERPLRSDNEINPEVLGYIFEKYINQRLMGAYYTKEDITGYIAQNTIVPFILEEAIRRGLNISNGDRGGWGLLYENPERYISEPMRRGVLTRDGAIIPPPEIIQTGMADILERTDWNRPSLDEFALPTETWREYATRRSRCLLIRSILQSGNVHSVNDLITHNLDIRQFAQDLIEYIDSPEDLRAIYSAILHVRILDPTCGSGAFLFAGLNVLEPLYEACLDVMQRLLDESHASGRQEALACLADFQSIVGEASRHPNRCYFILKSIITNNLFGVDIMDEACEVCKLRLFLKLAAQVEPDTTRPNFGLEPLPDIDFNIRAGNSVVGFVSYDEVIKSLTTGQTKFGNEDLLESIEKRAQSADMAFESFRGIQTGSEVTDVAFAETKKALRNRFVELGNELDRYLAKEYGISERQGRGTKKRSEEFEEWCRSHRPFHWFVQFYGIMKSGGFNIVIGNPPYLDRGRLAGLYEPHNMLTNASRDIYAWFVERGLALRQKNGRLGLIIPVSSVSSEAFDALRTVVWKGKPILWLSHFANRPGQLFTGAQNRLTILLYANNGSSSEVFSTRYHRWDAQRGERAALFATLEYVALGELARKYYGLFPKIGSANGIVVLKRLVIDHVLGENLVKSGKFRIYWVRVPGYFCQFFLDPPKARPENGGLARERGELNSIVTRDKRTQKILHAILNSSMFYLFFCAYMDGRHVNPSDVYYFPLDLSKFEEATVSALIQLSDDLERSMKASVSQWRKSGLLIDSVDSRLSKSIIDDIDRILGKHYDFTKEVVDFIINYDVKYRMDLDNYKSEE